MNSMRKYEDYLESVVRRSQDRFPNLEALYQHYASLKNAQNKLSNLSSNMEKNLESKRVSYALLEREKSSEVVLLNNDITGLQKKLEVRFPWNFHVGNVNALIRILKEEDRSCKRRLSKRPMKQREETLICTRF